MVKILIEQNGERHEGSYEELDRFRRNPDFLIEQVSSEDGTEVYVIKTRLMG